MKFADIIALSALIVAGLAAWLSWYTFYKTDQHAREGFQRNYRPYVSAASFSYINKNDGKWYPKMDELMIRVLNAHALITRVKLSFYIRNKNTDSLIFEQPEITNTLFYPVDNQQFSLISDRRILNNDMAQKALPALLIRKMRIDYQWISDSSLQYYYVSEWKYNLESLNWDVIYQTAN